MNESLGKVQIQGIAEMCRVPGVNDMITGLYTLMKEKEKRKEKIRVRTKKEWRKKKGKNDEKT